jgi:hypothetical protein
MDCQNFDHELEAFVGSGDPSPDARSHASACLRCGRRRNLVRALGVSLRATTPASVPPVSLDERILAASRGTFSGSSGPWHGLPLRLAAGFLLLLGGAAAIVASRDGRSAGYEPLHLLVVEVTGSPESAEVLALEQLFNEAGPELAAGSEGGADPAVGEGRGMGEGNDDR